MIPQFLVIGTQKSGTTWLDRNLRRHPDVWLPPEKEIHYFNLPKNMPFTSYILSRNADVRRWVIKRLERAYRKAKSEPGTILWHLVYYTMPRNKYWYRTLFRPKAGQMPGEVTPHYAVMPDRNIADVRSLRPDMKIIYLLRNPIDRMWSHAAMQFSEKYGQQGIGEMDERAILDFLMKPNHLVHGRYFENLTRWENHFPKNQIFVGYFDEIAEEPNRLLSDTFRFLGLRNTTECISEKATEKVYAGQYPSIPRHIAEMLARIFIDDLKKLHQHLNSPYTAKWLAQCESLLEMPDRPDTAKGARTGSE